jgi:hypothetical protein
LHSEFYAFGQYENSKNQAKKHSARIEIILNNRINEILLGIIKKKKKRRKKERKWTVSIKNENKSLENSH